MLAKCEVAQRDYSLRDFILADDEGDARITFVGLAQLIIYRLIRRMDWLEVLKVKE